MSTSAAQNPASSMPGPSPSTPGNANPPERVYVTLPTSGAHGVRAARNARQPLLQWLSTAAAALMCLSLPGASGVIMVLLLVHAGAAGFTWLWVPMIIFVEIIAVGCAIGIWREVTGWASPRDYQES